MYSCSWGWPTAIKKSRSVVTQKGGTMWQPLARCLSRSKKQSSWYIGMLRKGSIFKCFKWPWFVSFFFFFCHCIFLVQYFCTKREWKCQDLAWIVLTWPLEGNRVLSSRSLLFITLPATSLKGGGAAARCAACPPAERVCGLTLLCHVLMGVFILRSDAWANLFSMEQKPWWWLSSFLRVRLQLTMQIRAGESLD